MTYFVLFNEMTLLRALRLILAGSTVYLVPYPAVFGPLTKMLERMASLLARWRRCRLISAFDEHLATKPEHRVLRLLDDIFRRIEPSLEREFDFVGYDRRLGRYGTPYKQVTCNYISSLFPAVYDCWHVSQKPSNDGRTLVAPDRVVQWIYETYFKAALPFSLQPGSRILRFVCRALTLASVYAAALFAAAKGLRFKTRKKHAHALIATDFAADPADLELARELTDGHLERALIVFRSRSQERHYRAMVADFPSCCFGDGGFSFSEMLEALAGCFRDVRRIASETRDLPENLATLMIALPYKRLLIQKLLSNYQIDFFWARDEYNVEHILRTQELRRRGALSMGLCHGLPSVAIVVPMIRYVDFDVYCAIGERFPTHYKDTWSKTMKVRAVGSRGMTRSRAAALRAGRATSDIIFQTKPWKNTAPLQEALDILAMTFPDRRIFLQVKRGFDVYPASARLVDEATRKHRNVIETSEKIYDLFLKARYLVSDPSTIVAEAVQFDVVPFLLDLEGQSSLFLREFPSLAVRDGHDIVSRIRTLESGAKPSWQQSGYDGLVARNVQSFSDEIRMEMGLPVRPLPTATAAVQAVFSGAAS